MADRIQLRRDTAANWTSSNPVLALGEAGFETDTRLLKIGNGSTAWNSLAYTVLRVGTTANTVAAGNDSRLSNSRTPTAHKLTHCFNGSDALTPQDINAVPIQRRVIAQIGLDGGGTLGSDIYLDVKYGSIAGTSVEGNDPRIEGPREPTIHNNTHAIGGSDPIYYYNIGAASKDVVISTSNGLQGGGNLNEDRNISPVFGTDVDTICQGNDIRLVNSRPPNGEASGDLGGDFPNPKVVKLQGIEVQDFTALPPLSQQVLTYNQNLNQWIADSPQGGGSNATQLQGYNVSSAAPVTGEFLKWDGSVWVSGAVAGDSHDAYYIWGRSISSSEPSVNQVLTWDGSNWSPQFAGGGSSNATQLQGYPINSGEPGTGQFLKWDSTQWIASNQSFDAQFLRGSIISESAPNTGQYLQWNGSAWAPNNQQTTTDATSLQGITISEQDPSEGMVLYYSSGNWVPTYPEPGGSNATQLQGYPISSAAPNTDLALVWNGTSWESGYAHANAVKIQGNSISDSAPSAGQALVWNGGSWAPATQSASSDATYLQSRPIATNSPNTNQVLGWDGSFWTPQDPPGSSSNATQLQGYNIATNAPTTGQYLYWNGSEWLPSNQSTSATELQGYPISSNQPGNGNVLQWDSTQWVASSPSANATQLQGFDVSSDSPFLGSFLGWNGFTWIPTSQSTNATTLQGYPVEQTAPQETQVLSYGGSGWTPTTLRIVGGMAWNPNLYYNYDDVVTVSGLAYCSLTNGNVGNDPSTSSANWAVLVANPVDNAALGGIPTAPTASAGTDTTQIATTAFTIANRGDRYLTTSTTSNAITNGAKTFTVQTGLSYIPTQDITVVYDNSNHMHGTVTSYDSGTGIIVIDVAQHTGSGTYTAWTINVGGLTSINGALLSANNLNDVANASTSLTNLGGVSTDRQVLSGTGLTGGGDLTTDRTLSVVFGSTSTTSCSGNDSRLSDSRTPTGTAGGALTGTYPDPGLATVAIGSGGTGSTTASGARSSLGLAIGSDVQGYSANTTLLGNNYTGTGSLVCAASPTLTGTTNVQNVLASGGFSGNSVYAKLYAFNVKTITSSQSASSDLTSCVFADATSGNIVYTLYTAGAAGIFVVIKKIDSSSNTVTINCGANTIDGASSVILTIKNQSVSLVLNPASGDYFIV